MNYAKLHYCKVLIRMATSKQLTYPPKYDLTVNSTSIIFHQCQIGYYLPDTSFKGLPTSCIEESRTVIRMFGRTAEGISVCCHLHGFKPFIAVKLPSTFDLAKTFLFKTGLNAAIQTQVTSENEGTFDGITDIQIDECSYKTSNITGSRYIIAKLVLETPNSWDAVVTFLERSETSVPGFHNLLVKPVFCDKDFMVSFLRAINTPPFAWVEVPAGSYIVRSELRIEGLQSSLCDLDIDVHFSRIKSTSPMEPLSRFAPFVIFSLDIECAVRNKSFVEPATDSVLQISSTIVRHGEMEPFLKTIFTLDTCAPIEDVEIRSFSKESEMLEGWAEFFRNADADVVTGYNILNFDLWYLLERSRHLKLTSFDNLGRNRTVKSTWREAAFEGTVNWRQKKIVDIDGRLIFDVYLSIPCEQILPSYKLGYVSAVFLEEQKRDVHYSLIPELQNGDRFSRQRLAYYCLQDSLLPIKLLNTLGLFEKFVNSFRDRNLHLFTLHSVVSIKQDQVETVIDDKIQKSDIGVLLHNNNDLRCHPNYLIWTEPSVTTTSLLVTKSNLNTDLTNDAPSSRKQLGLRLGRNQSMSKRVSSECEGLRFNSNMKSNVRESAPVHYLASNRNMKLHETPSDKQTVKRSRRFGLSKLKGCPVKKH